MESKRQGDVLCMRPLEHSVLRRSRALHRLERAFVFGDNGTFDLVSQDAAFVHRCTHPDSRHMCAHDRVTDVTAFALSFSCARVVPVPGALIECRATCGREAH